MKQTITLLEQLARVLSSEINTFLERKKSYCTVKYMSSKDPFFQHNYDFEIVMLHDFKKALSRCQCDHSEPNKRIRLYQVLWHINKLHNIAATVLIIYLWYHTHPESISISFQSCTFLIIGSRIKQKCMHIPKTKSLTHSLAYQVVLHGNISQNNDVFLLIM